MARSLAETSAGLQTEFSWVLLKALTQIAKIRVFQLGQDWKDWKQLRIPVSSQSFYKYTRRQGIGVPLLGHTAQTSSRVQPEPGSSWAGTGVDSVHPASAIPLYISQSQCRVSFMKLVPVPCMINSSNVS